MTWHMRLLKSNEEQIIEIPQPQLPNRPILRDPHYIQDRRVREALRIDEIVRLCRQLGEGLIRECSDRQELLMSLAVDILAWYNYSVREVMLERGSGPARCSIEFVEGGSRVIISFRNRYSLVSLLKALYKFLKEQGHVQVSFARSVDREATMFAWTVLRDAFPEYARYCVVIHNSVYEIPQQYRQYIDAYLEGGAQRLNELLNREDTPPELYPLQEIIDSLDLQTLKEYLYNVSRQQEVIPQREEERIVPMPVRELQERLRRGGRRIRQVIGRLTHEEINDRVGNVLDNLSNMIESLRELQTILDNLSRQPEFVEDVITYYNYMARITSAIYHLESASSYLRELQDLLRNRR